MKASPDDAQREDATSAHVGVRRESVVVARSATVQRVVGDILTTGLRTAAETVVMHVVWLDSRSNLAAAPAPAPAPGMDVRILDGAEVLEATLDPRLDLDPMFAPRALGKGDACVGVFVEGELVSYGWYASTPTEVAFGLSVGWSSPDAMYMYKGFTLPEHRGRGYYATGLAHARALLCERQSALSLSLSFFAFVRRDNARSLAAAVRAGYVADGACVASRHLGARGFLSASVRRRGLWLRR